MRYKSDVPKEKQIRLSQFRLFPGDRVLIKIRSVFYWGNVVEVCSANPEYVLGGAGAKGAGVIRWKEEDREDCRAFLLGGHKDVPIRLKKSMWAVIGYSMPRGLSGHLAISKEATIKIFTYDIETMLQEDRLRILELC